MIDFGDDGPADAAGNEIVLGEGVVALAQVGRPIGRYEVKPGELTLTLPMPAIAGEDGWQMLAYFALPENLGAQTELIGVMRGVVPRNEAVAHPCILRRRPAQA